MRHAPPQLQKRKNVIRSLTAAQHAAQLVIRANDSCHRKTKPAIAAIWTKYATVSTAANYDHLHRADRRK